MKCPCCNGTGEIPGNELKVDAIIEFYYRQRAAGGKRTIKDLAESSEYSCNYLRKKKMEYDRRGGWGSKKAKRT